MDILRVNNILQNDLREKFERHIKLVEIQIEDEYNEIMKEAKTS